MSGRVKIKIKDKKPKIDVFKIGNYIQYYTNNVIKHKVK